MPTAADGDFCDKKTASELALLMAQLDKESCTYVTLHRSFVIFLFRYGNIY